MRSRNNIEIQKLKSRLMKIDFSLFPKMFNVKYTDVNIVILNTVAGKRSPTCNPNHIRRKILIIIYTNSNILYIDFVKYEDIVDKENDIFYISYEQFPSTTGIDKKVLSNVKNPEKAIKYFEDIRGFYRHYVSESGIYNYSKIFRNLRMALYRMEKEIREESEVNKK